MTTCLNNILASSIYIKVEVAFGTTLENSLPHEDARLLATVEGMPFSIDGQLSDL